MSYKFVFKTKREMGMRNNVILLTPKTGEGSYSFSRKDFDLISLFDGERSIGEVSEEFYRGSGVRVSLEDLEGFIAQMVDNGFLEQIQAEPEVTLAATKGQSRSQSWGQGEDGRRRGPFQQRFDRLRSGGRARPHRVAANEMDDVVELVSSDPAEQVSTVDPVDPVEEAEQSAHELIDELDRMEDDGIGSGFGAGADEDTGRQLQAVLPADRFGAGAGPGAGAAMPGAGFSRPGGFGATGESAGAEKGDKAKQLTPKIWLHVPIRGIVFIGGFFALPARNALTKWLLLTTAFLLVYGLWANRVEYFRDLSILVGPLNMAHMLLISMMTVNLFGQLARASAFRTLTGRLPEFGIILAFKILPRFFANIFEKEVLTDKNGPFSIISRAYYALISLFCLSFIAWLSAKDTATFIPNLLVGVGSIAAINIVLQLNPLGKGYGYQLLSHVLGVKFLRERSLAALFGVKGRPQQAGAKDAPPSWGFKLYGLLVMVYFLLVATLIFNLLGGWLEEHWGGLGVIIFTIGMLVLAYDPAKKVLAMKKKQREWQAAAPSRRKAKPPAVRKSLVWTLVLLSSVWVGLMPYQYEPGGDFEILPNRRVDVRALLDGDIREIYVKEGDFVSKGQLLARMADDEERTNVKVTEARLAEARSELALKLDGAKSEEVDLARQRIQTAQTRYGFSKARAERMVGLVSQKLVSKQEYENALSTAEVDKEQLVEAQKSLSLLLSEARPQEIEVLQAEIEKGKAELEYHHKQAEYTRLRAQIDGQIVSGSLQFAVGDYLKKGDPLATIEDTLKVTGEIKVPQTDIGEVKIGSKVRLKLWSFPDREFYGVVRSIAPVAETSDYGKVVRVMTEINNAERLLKSEMTGYAKINGDTMPTALAFTRMLRRFFLVELWSWVP